MSEKKHYGFIAYGVPVPKQSVKFRVIPLGVNPKTGKQMYSAKPYQPKAVTDYTKLVKLQAMKNRPQEPLDGCIVLVIDAYFPMPKYILNNKKKFADAISGKLRPKVSPDWDNTAKPICDAIEGMYYTNDSRIVDGRLRKWYAEKPRIVVEIVLLEE